MRNDFEFYFTVTFCFLVVLPVYSLMVTFSCEGYDYVRTTCTYGDCVEVRASLCDMILEARQQKMKEDKELELWHNTSQIRFYREARP